MNISFEEATHKGRQICDERELGAGYCGSLTFEAHCEQLANKDSWVQSSKDRWLTAYVKFVCKEQIASIQRKAEEEIKAIIDTHKVSIR